MKRAYTQRKRTEDTKPIFLFDICGEKIATYKNIYYFSRSRFYKKWIGKDTARFSNNKEQTCVVGKFFISRQEDFIVDYFTKKRNHNPLRITQHPRYKYIQNTEIIIDEAAFYIYYKPIIANYGGWNKDRSEYTPESYIYQKQIHVLENSDSNFRSTCSLNISLMNEFFLKINNEDEFEIR